MIKLDQKRNNVVVSRRAVIESENSAERDQLLENLQESMEVKGIVKNLTDYGAFLIVSGDQKRRLLSSSPVPDAMDNEVDSVLKQAE